MRWRRRISRSPPSGPASTRSPSTVVPATNPRSCSSTGRATKGTTRPGCSFPGPAGGLWGLSAREAEEAVIQRRPRRQDWQVAAIGPAGERLILFATLRPRRRPPLPACVAAWGGAVLGAKRIKAVAVRGDRRTRSADPTATVAIAPESFRPRSFGPATAKYRELGTVANLLVFNRFDALPTRNFQSGHFEGAGRLATEDLGPARRVARRPQQARPARSAASTSTRWEAGPRRAAAASGSNTSRCSRSGRSAGSTTPRPFFARRPPATTRGSTRSRPAAPSPS